MNQFKPRLIASLGLAMMASGALIGCESGEGGEKGHAAASSNSGEAASGESGGEGASHAPVTTAASGEGAGEAGVGDAYSAVADNLNPALAVAQLSGFLRVAEKAFGEGDGAAASILIQQGLLEVGQARHDLIVAAGGGDLFTDYQNIMTALDQNKPAAEIAPLFATAHAHEAKAIKANGDNGAALTAALLTISSGLYTNAVTPQGDDPIEYQHSFGAALAAQSVFTAAQSALSRADKQSSDEAAAAIAALVRIYPAAVPPEHLPTVAAIEAAVARVQLPLSSLTK